MKFGNYDFFQKRRTFLNRKRQGVIVIINVSKIYCMTEVMT